jgi:hypothetical protein
MERIWKYIKIFYKGITGISMELFYPFLILSFASAIGFLFYFLIFS